MVRFINDSLNQIAGVCMPVVAAIAISLAATAVAPTLDDHGWVRVPPSPQAVVA